MLMLEPLAIEGAFWLIREPARDERGWFLRLRSEEELRACGLHAHYAQASVSFNEKKFTTRGLHYQASPHEEIKIVTCLQGEVFDVIADLRPHSKTHGKALSVHLQAGSGRSLYIPKGCAHGFQTLTDRVLLHYEISVPYAPQAARGVQWLDKNFDIQWPCLDLDQITISEKDLELPVFTGLEFSESAARS